MTPYEQGFAAGLAGQPRYSNPYRKDGDPWQPLERMSAAIFWNGGYNAGLVARVTADRREPIMAVDQAECDRRKIEKWGGDDEVLY